MNKSEIRSAMAGYAQCLSLSRPDSYSLAGRVADAFIRAEKYPQPMLFVPSSGLVTLETPGFTGLAQMRWLDKLSSPKRIQAKAYTSQTAAGTLQGQQRHAGWQGCFTRDHSISASARTSLLLQRPETAATGALSARATWQQHPQQLSASSSPWFYGVPGSSVSARATAAATALRDSNHSTSERMTLTAPYTFRWGGRVKAKHASFNKMHDSTMSTSPCSTSRSTRPDQSNSPRAAVGAISYHQQEAAEGHAGGRTLGNKQQQLEYATAAAAAELGAHADKLYRVLSRHRRQQRGGSSRAQTPRGGAAAGRPMQPSRNSGSMRISHYGGDDVLEFGVKKLSLMPQEFLKL